MKRTAFALTFAVALFVPSLPAAQDQVEHAPTVAQCQADQRLWLSRLENDSYQLPTYGVIDGWRHEMFECVKVDPRNQQTYYNTMSEATTAQLVRLRKFLDRRNLFAEFLQEDAAGKRKGSPCKRSEV